MEPAGSPAEERKRQQSATCHDSMGTSRQCCHRPQEPHKRVIFPTGAPRLVHGIWAWGSSPRKHWAGPHGPSAAHPATRSSIAQVEGNRPAPEQPAVAIVYRVPEPIVNEAAGIAPGGVRCGSGACYEAIHDTTGDWLVRCWSLPRRGRRIHSQPQTGSRGMQRASDFGGPALAAEPSGVPVNCAQGGRAVVVAVETRPPEWHNQRVQLISGTGGRPCES